MRKLRAVVAGVLTVAWIATPFAWQSPATVAYEAASVKANRGSGTASLRRQPGRLTVVNFPLRTLITIAHGIEDFQLVGAPAWISDARFDIVATLKPAPSPTGVSDPHALALRAILADRFALRTRREARDLDIYALVKARPDGRLGPALKRARDDCNGVKPSGSPPGELCGVRESLEGIRLGGAPLSRFASTLSRQLGRQVVDRTGLSGPWDFELTFARELRGPLPPGLEPPDPNGPSLFTAIQEQLGLKLEATKGPVDVAVVESVRRPTDN